MNWNIAVYLCFGLLLYGCSKKVDEAGAIKKLLEKESATWCGPVMLRLMLIAGRLNPIAEF